MRRPTTGFLAAALVLCACGSPIVARGAGAASAAPAIWSLQHTPGASGTSLLSVSCPTAKACSATGTRTAGAATGTVAEAWNGAAWTIERTPGIPGGTNGFLRGVSCTSAASCTAVGDYSAGTRDVTLAERWTGAAWTIEPTPNPRGAQSSFLYGVSCPAARSCTAVGYFIGRAGAEMPLAERWNGSAWSVEADLSPPGHRQGVLMGVSCTAASACTAVGLSPTPPGASRTLAEAWNGSAWSVQPTPDAPGARLNSLAAVSCTATACTAVGSDSASLGSTQTLAEARHGSAWSIEGTPNPGGATSSYLTGVSCTSTAACTASGHFVARNRTGLTLVEGWNGSKWSVQRALRLAGTANSYLNGVSCTSPAECIAVGNFVSAAPTQVALAERHAAG
jgi:hypothetical protein